MVRRWRSGMRPDQCIPPFDPTPVTVTKPVDVIGALGVEVLHFVTTPIIIANREAFL